MPIDPRFVDVDFSEQPEYTFGAAPEPRLMGNDAAKFSDNFEVIPESQWREIVAANDAAGGWMDDLVKKIKDQKKTVSCASQAALQAHEIVQAQEGGIENVVELSGMSLYWRCGSANSGSTCSKNLRELRERGALPVNNAENKAKFPVTMHNGDRYEKAPSGWEETAKLFRADEYFEIESVEEFGTALLKGHPVGYGRDGHAICSVRLQWENGQWMWKYANSWGPSWSDNGFGYDTTRKIKSGAYWCFCIRSNKQHAA